ncbi:hypothetical protein [Actinacidiphila glaucinigra]|uniref:Uncharacterized protein n=1 Tax=Actinacidiphila glaucinigra TaxID=235986 RepID=A0A239F4P8_9ACTN|nr:hypothetical protein [Actinacidiphila glaucinigra]SNS51132.1 hypothetical protein SAMN05216252_106282 [Actinacidiphila glaucinigra]
MKMTWALAGQHVDQWMGDDFTEAAAVFRTRVIATMLAVGMKAEIRETFYENFIAPIGESIAGQGREAIEAGQEWDTARGPILLALAPAA